VPSANLICALVATRSKVIRFYTSQNATCSALAVLSLSISHASFVTKNVKHASIPVAPHALAATLNLPTLTLMERTALQPVITGNSAMVSPASARRALTLANSALKQLINVLLAAKTRLISSTSTILAYQNVPSANMFSLRLVTMSAYLAVTIA